jgi:transcriptional regulator NrdR family protein
MLVIRRDKIKEDYNTLNLLLKLEIAAPISQEELNSEDINKLIKTLDSKVNNYNMSPSYLKNSSDEIAEHILSILT